MPPLVRATVVDLCTDTPKAGDSFLVDTNAWSVMVYDRTSQAINDPPPDYQLRDYPKYVKSALAAKARLLCCGLTFSELAHHIEKVERKIYAYGAGRDISVKEFRHEYPAQRKIVSERVADAWAQVLEMASLIPLNIDVDVVSSIATLHQRFGLDGYDLLMIEAMQRNGINKIITDDSDYIVVPDIVVFTANPRAIRYAQEAKKQRKRR